MDEFQGTIVSQLASIGMENNETNQQTYMQLLVTTPGLGEYISEPILFKEALNQSTTDGKKMVDCLAAEDIVPGRKVDKMTSLIRSPLGTSCSLFIVASCPGSQSIQTLAP